MSTHEKQKDKILLYRGTAEAREDASRAGAWWSTDPYYALRFSNGGEGQLFVAQVQREELTNYATDVSLDEGYENYLFAERDPDSVRLATSEEIKALNGRAAIDTPPNMPGGGSMLKRPDNPIEVGYEIFGPKDIGAVALSEATLSTEL